MTKKDYVLIADALYTASQNISKLFELEETRVITREFVNQTKRFLALDNPLFDNDKFDDYFSGLSRG